LSSKFRIKRDYYAGALMVLIGVGAVAEASRYKFGTLSHMQPGFFPILVGVALAFIGILIAGTAALSEDEEGDDRIFLVPPEWRGWACILAGPIMFIIFGKFLGLAPATFACVFVSALGDRTATWKSSLFLALAVTVFGVGLFSFVLKIPFPVWRW
jgi:hypothetical protein